MRVLLVTMDYPPPMGGIQAVARSLEEDLARAGHEVYLLNFDGRNSSNYTRLRFSDLFRSRATQNSYFRLLDMQRPASVLWANGYRGLVFQNLVYRLTGEARRRFRPDLTHILTPTLHSAVYDCQEPYVVSCHGSELLDTFPVRYSLQHATLIHCVSRYVKGLVANLIPDSQQRSVVIYNSVDLQVFSDRNLERENTIITCCRLVKRKNVDTVIRAVALLGSTLSMPYRHLIVGDGEETRHLKSLARRLNLRNVDFLGQITDPRQLARLLLTAKLFVLCPLPLDPGEGFGIAFIEAQAAGIPVIGSRDGGIPEAVGDAGLLVDNPADAAEIAAKIGMVLENTQVYEELASNARIRVKRFDRNTNYQEFERLYQRALDTI